ncbi:21509_t:CDS:2, partial [Gigaspora margarita]
MKAFDNFIPECKKVKITKPNQYETHTVGICSQNNIDTNEVENTVNNTNNQFSESKYDDLILELIDEYLAEEFLAEEEKRAIQELSNATLLYNPRTVVAIETKHIAKMDDINKTRMDDLNPRKGTMIETVPVRSEEVKKRFIDESFKQSLQVVDGKENSRLTYPIKNGKKAPADLKNGCNEDE